ncbi:MAG TPA: lantibiotic dehydratase [Chitinophaga sp.]|uniref:lantibiotic dehydratase n=1 Tax=Chitinophaga sp. TaxID=1869181 RepID=UPI002BBCAC9E|nr:lantibiotic dehydratase [Chitinophaga sp.]HVI45570.1 lantibiotic dehydratase [Chitinophaga sp.]
MEVWDHTLVRIGGAPFSDLGDMNARGAFRILDRMHNMEVTLKTYASRLADELHAIASRYGDNREILHHIINLRRDIFNFRKVKDGMVSSLKGLLDEDICRQIEMYQVMTDEIGEQQQLFDTTFENEYHQAKRQLRDLLRQEQFVKGLLLGSYALYQLRRNYLEDDRIFNSSKWDSEEIGYMKYYSRMVAKTSPFSTFTNLSLGSFHEETGMKAVPGSDGQRGESYTSLVRLNNHLLKTFLQVLLSYPPFYRFVPLRWNYTVYNADKKYNFLVNNNNNEAFQEIEKQPMLEYVARLLSRRRSRSFDKLTGMIMGATGATSDQAQQYVQHLLTLGLLEYDLAISGADPDWIITLISYVEKIAENEEDEVLQHLAAALRHINGLCESYSTADSQQRCALQSLIHQSIYDSYIALHTAAGLPEAERVMVRKFLESNIKGKELAEYQKDFTNSGKDIFVRYRETWLFIKKEQVLLEDTSLSRKFYLPAPLRDDIIPLLNKVCKLIQFSNYTIEKTTAVKDFFLKNYGRHKKVPLLKFYRAYVKSVKAPQDKEEKQSPLATEMKWAAAFCNSIRNTDWQQEHIDISLADIRVINEELHIPVEDTVVRSYGAFIQPCLRPDGQPMQIMINGVFHGYGRYISRFLPLFDETVTTYFREQNDLIREDTLYAEYNDASFFNANIHPPLMTHELVATGNNPYMPADRQISVKEIVVTWQEATDELILVHTSTGRRIMVFDLAFQSLAGRSAIFRFLSRFSDAIIPNFGLLVSSVYDTLEHETLKQDNAYEEIIRYPRITIEHKIVLSRKKWQIPVGRFPLINKQDSFAEKVKKIKAWQIQHGLPDESYICLRQVTPREQEMALAREDVKPQYMNLNNPMLLKILLKYLQKGITIGMEEMFPCSQSLMTEGDKKYLTELLIQWHD